MTAAKFNRMVKNLPMCLVESFDHLSHKTVEDLVFLAEHEIDITESGEDGTSRRNLKILRNWLAKWEAVPS